MTLRQFKNTILFHNYSLSSYLKYPNLKITENKDHNFVLKFSPTRPLSTSAIRDFSRIKNLQTNEGVYPQIPEITPLKIILTPAEAKYFITSWLGVDIITHKNAQICSRCSRGHFTPKKKLQKLKKLCDNCFNNYFRICMECRTYKDSTKVILNRVKNDRTTDKYICSPCTRRVNFVSCSYCNYWWQSKTIRELASGGRICREDFEREGFMVCGGCNKVESWNHMLYCYGTETFYCNKDYNLHVCKMKHKNKGIYNFILGKPDAHFNNIQRLVGVEIEAERGSGSLYGLVAPMTNIGSDGSLGSGGIELRTAPSMGDKIIPVITKTCEGLNQKGYIGTIKAGLHVHIDVNDIKNNPTKIMQIVKTYYSIEDILWSMLPPSRWGSGYCKKLMHTHPYVNIFNKKNKDLDTMWSGNGSSPQGHYQGLNLSSISDDGGRGTIEIRYHSGTTNAEKIINWIAINLCLFDYAINHFRVGEIQELVDMPTGQEKFDLFCQRFKIPSLVKSYMERRLDKFNPEWSVIFNRGKFLRELEIKQKAEIETFIAEQTKEVRGQIKRKLGLHYKKIYGTNWKTNISIEQMEADVVIMARNYIEKQIPKRLLQTRNRGFITDDEMREKVRLFNKIRKIGAQGRDDGERDEELSYV